VTDETALRELRHRLVKSGNGAAAAELDAGRARESDLLACFTALEKARGIQATPYDEPQLDQDGTPLEPLRKAYENAVEDGAVDLRAAAAELDRLVERYEGRGARD
jgi:hypothetical protein